MEKERIEDRILQIATMGYTIIGLAASGTLYELIPLGEKNNIGQVKEITGYKWKPMVPSPVWIKKKESLTPNETTHEQSTNDASGSVPQGPEQAADGGAETIGQNN